MQVDQYPEHNHLLQIKQNDKTSQGIYAKYSNYYSMYRANELKKQYEQQHNFTYDCVIHTRFDIFFYFGTKNLFEYDLSKKIYIPTTGQNFIHSTKNFYDYLFFSSSHLMDQFCQIFLSLPKVIIEIHKKWGKKYKVPTNHMLLAMYCLYTNTIIGKSIICFQQTLSTVIARKIIKTEKMNLTKVINDFKNKQELCYSPLELLQQSDIS